MRFLHGVQAAKPSPTTTLLKRPMDPPSIDEPTNPTP